MKEWIDKNRRWIEPSIVLSLFLTGSYTVGSIMLVLWIVDTM